MAHTTVIAALPGSSAAQRFVAICTAISFGERVRSLGDHALVVLDDLTCMVRLACRPSPPPAALVPASLEPHRTQDQLELQPGLLAAMISGCSALPGVVHVAVLACVAQVI